MRRFTGSIVMAFLTLLLAALPVGAGHEWCEKDPIVRLNGTTVQILVAVPAEDQHLVNGPIAVEIATPRGMARELVSTDDGFNGHGETVEFTDLGNVSQASMLVRIRVTVPLSQATPVPVQLTIVPDNADRLVVYGTSENTTAWLRIAGR